MGPSLTPKPATHTDRCEHPCQLGRDERHDTGRRDPRKRIGQRADIDPMGGAGGEPKGRELAKQQFSRAYCHLKDKPRLGGA